MNIMKTAQLNVYDMLNYLNYTKINQEQTHYYEQQQKCKGYQLNVRLKQNWITGPKQTKQQRARSLALNSNVSANSIHNVKAADGKSIVTTKVSELAGRSRPGPDGNDSI